MEICAEDIYHHMQLLGHHGYGVTELRTFDPRPMVAYTDNAAEVARLAREMDSRASGIYVGVQPRNVALLEKAPKRWKPATAYPDSNCACDNDIEYITAVFFDIDVVSPQRKDGYPASDNELQKSLEVAQRLASQYGLALAGVICGSGNGHYVIAPLVPIPVHRGETAQKFRRLCRNLAEKAGPTGVAVKLDPVYNLSRVMRLMGTVNRKGTPQPDRPHRMAHFVTKPQPVRSMALRQLIINTELPIEPLRADPRRESRDGAITRLEGCAFIQYCRQRPDKVTEPQWFGLITNLAHLQGGSELIHAISALDKARYDPVRAQRIIDRVRNMGYRPTRCRYLENGLFRCPMLSVCSVRAPAYFAVTNSPQEAQRAAL